MKYTPVTQQEGIRIAQKLKQLLLERGYPIRDVLLFGSVAAKKSTTWSDIDVAILCDPFLKSKHEENVEFLLACKQVDLRIQTVCLHPEDFENRYFGLAREIKQHGIAA